jgi:hypothetical protein
MSPKAKLICAIGAIAVIALLLVVLLGLRGRSSPAATSSGESVRLSAVSVEEWIHRFDEKSPLTTDEKAEFRKVLDSAAISASDKKRLLDAYQEASLDMLRKSRELDQQQRLKQRDEAFGRMKVVFEEVACGDVRASYGSIDGISVLLCESKTAIRHEMTEFRVSTLRVEGQNPCTRLEVGPEGNGAIGFDVQWAKRIVQPGSSRGIQGTSFEHAGPQREKPDVITVCNWHGKSDPSETGMEVRFPSSSNRRPMRVPLGLDWKSEVVNGCGIVGFPVVAAYRYALDANRSITQYSIVLADYEKGTILLESKVPSHLWNVAMFFAMDTRECVIYAIGADSDWMAMFDIKSYIEKAHPALLEKSGAGSAVPKR